MSRKLLVPLIILVSGWSWFTYLFKFSGDAAEQKAYFWGWIHPSMEPHWKRLEEDFSYHNMKNVASEYTGERGQASAKSFSLLTVLGVIGWLCLLGSGIYQSLPYLLQLF